MISKSNRLVFDSLLLTFIRTHMSVNSYSGDWPNHYVRCMVHVVSVLLCSESKSCSMEHNLKFIPYIKATLKYS